MNLGSWRFGFGGCAPFGYGTADLRAGLR